VDPASVLEAIGLCRRGFLFCSKNKGKDQEDHLSTVYSHNWKGKREWERERERGRAPRVSWSTEEDAPPSETSHRGWGTEDDDLWGSS